MEATNQTGRDLAGSLDLPRLGRRLPCSTGREGCGCDGCRAALLLGRAHGHLERGEYLEAAAAVRSAEKMSRDIDVAAASRRLVAALRVS